MTFHRTARPALVLAGALAVTLTAGPALAAASAEHTTLTITSTQGPKQSVTITGTLKTANNQALDGQVVRLVGRSNGTQFRTLGYHKTQAAKGGGFVTFTFTAPKGHDEYKLVYNGSHKTSPTYDGSHSRTITLTVSE